CSSNREHASVILCRSLGPPNCQFESTVNNFARHDAAEGRIGHSPLCLRAERPTAFLIGTADRHTSLQTAEITARPLTALSTHSYRPARGVPRTTRLKSCQRPRPLAIAVAETEPADREGSARLAHLNLRQKAYRARARWNLHGDLTCVCRTRLLLRRAAWRPP